jgi:hypothetical protein
LGAEPVDALDFPVEVVHLLRNVPLHVLSPPLALLLTLLHLPQLHQLPHPPPLCRQAHHVRNDASPLIVHFLPTGVQSLQLVHGLREFNHIDGGGRREAAGERRRMADFAGALFDSPDELAEEIGVVLARRLGEVDDFRPV